MESWKRSLISSPRLTLLTRIVCGAVVFTLIVTSTLVANRLAEIKNQTSEQDTISAGHDKLQGQLIAKIILFNGKISDAEKLGIDTTSAKEQLTIAKKLVFIEQKYTAANALLADQTAALNALIDQKTAANALAEAEKEKGVVTGMVKEGSALLSGVKVSLSQNGTAIGSATTEASGSYSLALKAGNYQLTGTKSGYNSFTQKSVTVTAQQTLTVNFSMTKATVAPPPSSSSGTTNGDSSYELRSVNAGGTTYSVHVATFNLASGQFRVVTDTANDDDCLDNCPTKSLSSYVSAHGAFAGMNGTYFCPADYAACSGKTGSFYWKVWNSRLNKMINGGTNSFVYEPFLTVNGNTAKYYNSWSDFSGSITAGISSSPALIAGGNNVLDHGKLDDKQRTVKSNRGAVGLKGQVLYLVIAKSATVIDLAGIMDALDVDSAMNLDGGGSSAMIFNGSYKIGPGRSIPNAIIVARR